MGKQADGKPGFFRFGQSRKERERDQKRLAKAVSGANSLDESVVAAVVKDAARFDPLDDLIRETERLLTDLGAAIPQTADECGNAILNRVFHGSPPSQPSMDAVKSMVAEFPRMVADPILLALEAYQSLKATEQMRASGDLEPAINALSGGAWFLARACTAAAAAAQSSIREKGATARHTADPKRAAKLGAYGLWKEWRAGCHPKIRTTEQFAIEVMRRWPVLQSSKVICSWSAQWGKKQPETRAEDVGDA